MKKKKINKKRQKKKKKQKTKKKKKTKKEKQKTRFFSTRLPPRSKNWAMTNNFSAKERETHKTQNIYSAKV